MRSGDYDPIGYLEQQWLLTLQQIRQQPRSK